MGQSRARRRTGAEGSPVRLTWRHANCNNCSKEKQTLTHSMACVCICVCALGWVYFASHYKLFALLHNSMQFYPTGAVLTQMNKWCCTIKTVVHVCTGKTKVKGHVLWWLENKNFLKSGPNAHITWFQITYKHLLWLGRWGCSLQTAGLWKVLVSILPMTFGKAQAVSLATTSLHNYMFLWFNRLCTLACYVPILAHELCHVASVSLLWLAATP